MWRTIWLVGAVACVPENNLRGEEGPVSVPNPLELAERVTTDRFIQTPPTVVDVLFVIDDSCSMIDEQDQLAANFPSFFKWFEGSGVDYHVGVTSTDMDNPWKSGRLVSAANGRWIDPDTPNAEAVFTDMALLGINGTGNEAGIGAAYAALELHAEDANAGFLRDSGGLQVIVISDEEDHSGTMPISRGEFVEYLWGLSATKDAVGFSSIVTPPGVFGMNGETPGENYLFVTEQVGGQVFDIRSHDWSRLLDDLGMEALGLKREFFLSQLPAAGSLEVWIIEDEVVFAMEEGEDWTYDAVRNSVTFVHRIPEPYAEVELTYTVLAAE
jgi:hypothetical protein